MMKAYIIHDKDWYIPYAEVVFAETRGKAIAYALGLESFEDFQYTDLRARRESVLDKYYRGRWHMEWDDMEDRFILVKALDLYCDDDYFDPDECRTCSAKDICSKYADYQKEEQGGE